MKKLMMSLIPLALSLTACSAKVSGGAPVDWSAPNRPSNGGVEIGRSAGQPFKVYQAVLLEHFGSEDLLTMTIYGEDVANPCFGLGDTLVTVPVSRRPTLVTRNVYSATDTDWMSQFWTKAGDTHDVRAVPGGFLQVHSFDGKTGLATVEIGNPSSSHFLKGDFKFENCVVDGW